MVLVESGDRGARGGGEQVAREPLVRKRAERDEGEHHDRREDRPLDGKIGKENPQAPPFPCATLTRAPLGPPLVSWGAAGRSVCRFGVPYTVARLRQVGTGVVSGDGVEIVSGLSAGEMVITRGGFNVRDGDRVKVTQGNGGA